jgi:hypothetical protein
MMLIANSARKLGNKEDILVSASMVHHTQYITCYVMCDEIGRQTSYDTCI